MIGTGAFCFIILSYACDRAEVNRDNLAVADQGVFETTSHKLAIRDYIRSQDFSVTLTIEEHEKNLVRTYKSRGYEVDLEEMRAIWHLSTQVNQQVRFEGRKGGPAQGILMIYDSIGGLSE